METDSAGKHSSEPVSKWLIVEAFYLGLEGLKKTEMHKKPSAFIKNILIVLNLLQIMWTRNVCPVVGSYSGCSSICLASERMNAYIFMIKWMNAWMNDWLNKRINNRLNDWTNGRMHERVDTILAMETSAYTFFWKTGESSSSTNHATCR